VTAQYQNRLSDVLDRHERRLIGHVYSQVRGRIAACGAPVSVGVTKYDRVTPTDCTPKVNFMRDPVSPRFAQLDRIEREDRLLDEIQCHASDIAGLFAIEPLARRIDQGDQHRAGLLQSPPLSFDSILKYSGRINTVLPALSARMLCGSHDLAPHPCKVVVSRPRLLQQPRSGA
jgi:hypothetical protein